MATTSNTDYATTLEEVALELGVSVTRAKQIEEGALRKLRLECQRRGLDLSDFFDLVDPDKASYRPRIWGPEKGR
jgi:DNA-directed RNA polymerase sigma subunit (sigma70/sigma32)